MNEDEVTMNFDITRTIYMSGEINSELAHRAMIAIETLDCQEGDIRIVLNSEGGAEGDGYAIYDRLRQCQNHIIIVGYGNIWSIAAAIFQAGDTKIMAPNASYMIHNGHIDTPGDMSQDAVVDLAKEIDKNNRKYYNILSEGSGQSLETIKEWCKEERFFSAQEAKEAGFCDYIIKPTKVVKKTRRKRKTKL